MTDIIGDIHGHAAELKTLLSQLGYSVRNGAYQHPDRRAIFVGDYIDRGPKIPEVLRIVRSMVDSGSAVALMGNHEYNALCFHYTDKGGGHLRRHSIKNILQHYETLSQFHGNQREYEAYIEWFKTLPLFYETSQFRVVHACWDNAHISYLRSTLRNIRLDEDTIHQSTIKDSPLYKAIDETLKGKEIRLPDRYTFKDKDQNERKDIRIRWWENPEQATYKRLSIPEDIDVPDIIVQPSVSYSSYSASEIPVFFGHYWLERTPFLYRDNVCCLDYSVAKRGDLVSYSFDNEAKLDENKFTIIPSFRN